MKKLLFLLFVTAFISFISCNNNTKTESTDTHTHADGSTHEDHDTSKPLQQEFKVADSAAKKDTGTHTHPDGAKHSHHDDKEKDKHD
ncbi:MAG: hypothetical protein SFU87_06380 [Chitinophagaceae bacterium]|nr:hypothetical protein [Chitinophagaceae bacterium]